MTDRTETLWPTARALIGIQRRRRVVGIGLFVLVVVIATAARLVPRWLLFGSENTGLAFLVDGLLSVAIFLALFVVVLSLTYAVWNGGPGLSFLLPLVPLVVSWLVTRQLVMTVDVALALAAGTLAATLATVSVAWHGEHPDRNEASRAIEAGIGIVAFGVILTATVLWRVSGAIGPHARVGFYAAVSLYAIALVLAIGFLALLGWHTTDDDAD